MRLTASSPLGLKQAELHFTVDTGPINQWQWKTQPATIEGESITADAPPAEATAWFVTVTDERGAIVSSRVVIR